MPRTVTVSLPLGPVTGTRSPTLKPPFVAVSSSITAPSGSLARPVRAWDDDLDPSGPPAPTKPARPIIPGERHFHDGDRVRHARWGDGIVVTSKLTRSDEEVVVAFKDATVGRKTMLVSLANLDLV